MNWFKKSSPYAENICPSCTSSLLIDLFFEKGPEFANASEGVGRCPVCHKPFVTRCLDKEQMMNFRYCNVDPISEIKYRNLVKKNDPVLLVIQSDD